MVTEKQIGKVQNHVLKNSKSLVGACKLYNELFKNCTELKAVCKELDIPIEVAVKLSKLAKEKDATLKACLLMLPKVDNTFVRFVTYEKTYFNNKDRDKNTKISEKQSEKIVVGTTFKPFGLSEAVSYSDTDEPYYNTVTKEDYRLTTVAVRIENYNVQLVAKCVKRYLSIE